jgi:hypothetical protein
MFDRIWQLSYNSATIDILRNSSHAIPLIQSFHLFGITLLLGAMVALNFRMLGIGLKQIPLETVARQVWSWGTAGLILTIVSGILVFIPDPARYAANASFLTKMTLLLIAIVFQYTVYRRTVRERSASPSELASNAIPIVSLTLWFCVGWAGRAIAFLG